MTAMVLQPRTRRRALVPLALALVATGLGQAAADDPKKKDDEGAGELKPFLVLTDGSTVQVDKVKDATKDEVSFQVGGSLQKRKADEVARVVPTGDPALDYAVRLMTSGGDPARIEAQLKRALERGEAWVKPYAQYFLGEVYERQNKPNEAIAAYEAVATLAKDHFYAPVGIYRVVALLDRGGKGAEAQQRLQRLASGEFGRAWADRAGYQQARGLLGQGKHAEARAVFARLRSGGAADLQQLAAAGEAQCDLLANKKDDARRGFRSVISNRAAPGAALGIAWKGAGDCEKGGNNDEALLCYLRSFLLYPSSPEARAAAAAAGEIAGAASIPGAQRMTALSRGPMNWEDHSGPMADAELMRRTNQQVSAQLVQRFAPALAGKAQGDEKAELEFIACDALRTVATQTNNADLLKEYETKLKDLQAKYPNHGRAALAGLDSFQATKDRALALIGKANEETDPAKKEALLAEGRALFATSLEPFKKTIEEFTKKVDALTDKEAADPKAMTDAEKEEKGETEYRRDLAEFFLAEAYATFAQTYPEGSDDRKKNYREALKLYDHYINDRGTFPNLLNYSYVGSVEANIELGNYDDAIGTALALTDVDLPYEPADPQQKKAMQDMVKDVCIRAYLNLLKAYCRAGKFQEGMQAAAGIDSKKWAKGWQDHPVGILFQFERAKAMGGAGQGAKAAEELYEIVRKARAVPDAEKIPALGMSKIGAGACRALSELSDASGGEVYAPEVQFHVGIGYFLAQRVELAIAAFKGVLVSAKTPEERREWVPKAVKEIGQLLFGQERYLEAALAYETVVREFPDHDAAQEAVRFSLAAAKKACEQFKEDPTGTGPIARYYKQVSAAAAGADWEKAVQLRMNEAADYQTKGQFAQAAESYAQVPAEVDDKGTKRKVRFYANAQSNAGYCYFQAYKASKKDDQLAKAREFLARAAQVAKTENDPESQSLACFYLGELENDLKRPAEALRALAPFDAELAGTTKYIVRARFQQVTAYFDQAQPDALDRAEAAYRTVEDKASDPQFPRLAYKMASAIRAQAAKLTRDKADLAQIRTLRQKAARYAKAFYESSDKKTLRDQVYWWAGDVLFSGGLYADAAVLYREALGKLERPAPDGKQETTDKLAEFETAELNLAYCLAQTAAPREAIAALARARDLVQIKDRDGRVLEVGVFKGRKLEGPFQVKIQGRQVNQQVWFTVLEVGGQEKKYFDTAPPAGADSEFKGVEGTNPGAAWQPGQQRTITLPYKRDYLVVDGMMKACWAEWEAGKDKNFLASDVTAASNELRYVLRGMSDASYYSLVANSAVEPTDFQIRSWTADLQYLRLKLARELWREVASDMKQMELLGKAPPPALKAEYDAIKAEAESKQ